MYSITDGRHYDANSRSYCMQNDRLKNNKFSETKDMKSFLLIHEQQATISIIQNTSSNYTQV